MEPCTPAQERVPNILNCLLCCLSGKWKPFRRVPLIWKAISMPLRDPPKIWNTVPMRDRRHSWTSPQEAPENWLIFTPFFAHFWKSFGHHFALYNQPQNKNPKNSVSNTLSMSIPTFTGMLMDSASKYWSPESHKLLKINISKMIF